MTATQKTCHKQTNFPTGSMLWNPEELLASHFYIFEALHFTSIHSVSGLESKAIVHTKAVSINGKSCISG